MHIPKCGGTSFREYLNLAAIKGGLSTSKIYIPGYNNIKTSGNYDQLNFARKILFKRRDYKVIAMHTHLNLYIARSQSGIKPFIYTIFRNPIDRFISHYYHFYYYQGAHGCKNIDLLDLDPGIRSHLINQMSNSMVKHLAGRKLKDEVVASDFTLAQTNLDKLSCFGILENIEESISLLKAKAPKWLVFPSFIQTRNERRVLYKNDSVVDKQLLMELEASNSFDLKLYEYAKVQFEMRKSHL